MSAAIKTRNTIGARYRVGMWVSVASIAMLFTSLTSAYIVRSATSYDWLPIAVPRALFVSTGLLLLSSITLELARQKLKRSFQDGYSRYLLLTVLLGLVFLASQLSAWRQLARQGVYLVSHPHSSFFYLLTGAHALHLLGGLLSLMFLWLRSQRQLSEPTGIARRQAAADAVTIYWHFMDALWIYLFLLLFLWR